MLDIQTLLRPTSATEAVELYSKGRGSGLYVAGGTIVLPAGSPNLDFLVDLSGAGLDYVRASDGGAAPYLSIGAGTRVGDLVRIPEAAEFAGGLIRNAAAVVSGHTVRNRATVGGNIVASHYPTDLPPVFLALDATIKVLNLSGTTEVALRDFYDRRREVHKKGDLIVEVCLPCPDQGATSAFVKLGRTKLDVAIVNCAVVMSRDGGAVARAAVAVNGVGGPPRRLPDVETFLAGKKVDPKTFLEAGRLAAGSVSPKSDYRAAAGYRKTVLGVVVNRALREAAGMTDA